jgi:LuxR family maltose regulon positive regulatory protein
MPTPLLTTKFYPPPARPERLPRPRLLVRLGEALARPLTVVVAPAGAGKSTLLSEWAAQCGCPVGWLSLEPEDDEPLRFWRYLAAAWQRAAPEVGALTGDVLQAAVPAPIAAALGALVNDLAAHDGPLCLVLEDYYFITREAIHRDLAFLIDHLPPQAHLIVSTRTEPPLGLAQRRGRGQLAELRLDDLRFSPQEAADYLNERLTLDLAAADVRTLEARTEGWAVALHLAALSLQGERDRHARVAAFSGADRFVADYLLAEVVGRQPAAVQAFLVATAGLERLCAPLCDAVAGGHEGAEMLAYLERANLLLIPLDNQRLWYRYHHLLADLLRRQAAAESAEWVAERHRRAATWYATQGLRADAIHHALAAGDYDLAAELVEAEALPTIFRAETVAAQGWLAAIPDEIIARRPILAVAKAWVVVVNEPHDMVAAEGWLQAAERAAAEMPATVQREVLGHVLAARALIARNLGGAALEESVALSRQALAQLADSDASLQSALWFNLGAALLDLGQVGEALPALEAAGQAGGPGHYAGAMAIYCLAEVAHLRGRLPQAETYCRAALGRLVPDAAGRVPPIAGALQIALGRVYLEWDRLAEAEALLAQGARAMAATGEVALMVLGLQGLAWIHALQGEAERVVADLAQANAVAGAAGRALVPAAGRALAPSLWWRLGQNDPALAEQARRWASEVVLPTTLVPPPGLFPLNDDYAAYVLAVRLRIAGAGRGDRLEAEAAFLVRQYAEAARQGWVDQQLTLRLLQARLYQARGEQAAALSALDDALALAAPGGYLRTFLDEGAPLARLLYRRLEDGSPGPDAARLLARLAAVASPATPDGGLIEALSLRERQVLALIADGLSNQEIALHLHLTVGTVKVHAHRIYAKLGVSGRMAALSRARALGLLDDR